VRGSLVVPKHWEMMLLERAEGAAQSVTRAYILEKRKKPHQTSRGTDS